jgi:hypothetical protein
MQAAMIMHKTLDICFPFGTFTGQVRIGHRKMSAERDTSTPSLEAQLREIADAHSDDLDEYNANRRKIMARFAAGGVIAPVFIASLTNVAAASTTPE